VNHKRSDRFLTDRDVASITSMKVSTLRKWRMFGRGPHYYKIHGAIRYRWCEVEEWLSGCAKTPRDECARASNRVLR
jgi:predicted DNA-binding transcriptional regulator AlpA